MEYDLNFRHLRVGGLYYCDSFKHPLLVVSLEQSQSNPNGGWVGLLYAEKCVWIYAGDFDMFKEIKS